LKSYLIKPFSEKKNISLNISFGKAFLSKKRFKERFMIARIRDFVITKHDWIFSVVSYDFGGEGLKCLLRYIPDETGERVSERGRYKKLDFDEAYEFLRTYRPEYVKDVHVVPKGDIKEILRPEQWLPVIAEREEKVNTIYELLRKKCANTIAAWVVERSYHQVIAPGTASHASIKNILRMMMSNLRRRRAGFCF
jgi:hypothetical protein